MNNTIDFEELEAKTSAEFVEKVKKALVDYEGNEIPIKAVKVDEYKIDDQVQIDNLRVWLIVDGTCHEFYYCKIRKHIAHQFLSISTVLEFSSMFNDYKKSIGA